MPDDQTTISLSDEGDRIVRELVERGWFSTQVAAFQAAVGVAIAHELTIDRSDLKNQTTKWNVGTLDPRLRDMIMEFGRDAAESPYETATILAEAGLRRLASVLDDEAQLASILRLDAGSDEGVEGEEES